MVDEPAPAEPRTGLLLVRAWTEPDTPHLLRARLLTPRRGPAAPGLSGAPAMPASPAMPAMPDGLAGTTWATAAGTDAICGEVLRWLRELDPPR